MAFGSPTRRNLIKGAGTAGLGAFATAKLGLPLIGSARASENVLRASIIGNMPHLNPYMMINHDLAAIKMMLYNNLIYTAPDGSLHPEVAREMPEVSEDGLSYRFHLRDDVRFHNGKLLTADDVIYSWGLNLEKSWRVGDFQGFLSLNNIHKEDDHTVRFDLSQPWSGWLMYMTKYTALVPDGADFENLRDGPGNNASGAYFLEHFDPDVNAIFVANPDYFEGERRQKMIEIRRIADASTQLSNLLGGDIDIISSCPPADFHPTMERDGFTGGMRPSAGIFYGPLNRTKPPFDNVHLRRAFALAVDRDYIANVIYYGLLTPSSIPAAPDEYWYDEGLAAQLDYNPERAREELALGGHPNGFEFEAIIPVPSAYVEAMDAAIIIQANLADIGVQMNIRQMDFSTMYDTAATGDYIAFPSPSMQPSIEDYLLAQSYRCDAGKQYISQPCNPEYDQALDAAYAISPNDHEARRPHLIEATRHLVEDATSLWLGRMNTYHLWRDSVHEFEPSYMYSMDFRTAYKS